MSDLAERVASLEMALRNVGQVLVAKREQWCGAIDCHCVLARLALRHGPVPRRPDPTPDKINEDVRRGAEMSPSIIFSIAAGLAYTLWVAGIVEFATHMAPI